MRDSHCRIGAARKSATRNMSAARAFPEHRARMRSLGSAGESALALSTSRSAAPLARGRTTARRRDEIL